MNFEKFLKKNKKKTAGIADVLFQNKDAEIEVIPVKKLGEWNWRNGGKDFAEDCLKVSKAYDYAFNLKFCKKEAEHEPMNKILPIEADRFLKSVDCLGEKTIKKRLEAMQ